MTSFVLVRPMKWRNWIGKHTPLKSIFREKPYYLSNCDSASKFCESNVFVISWLFLASMPSGKLLTVVWKSWEGLEAAIFIFEWFLAAPLIPLSIKPKKFDSKWENDYQVEQWKRGQAENQSNRKIEFCNLSETLLKPFFSEFSNFYIHPSSRWSINERSLT